jgi:hypothetical protein
LSRGDGFIVAKRVGAEFPSPGGVQSVVRHAERFGRLGTGLISIGEHGLGEPACSVFMDPGSSPG